MSTGKEELDVDEELVSDEQEEEVVPAPEVAQTNLAKRRTIDNLLEERSLQKQLSDYDYDL